MISAHDHDELPLLLLFLGPAILAQDFWEIHSLFLVYNLFLRSRFSKHRLVDLGSDQLVLELANTFLKVPTFVAPLARSHIIGFVDYKELPFISSVLEKVLGSEGDKGLLDVFIAICETDDLNLVIVAHIDGVGRQVLDQFICSDAELHLFCWNCLHFRL